MIGSFLRHNPWFEGDIRVVVPRQIKGLEARLRQLWPALGVTLPDPELNRAIHYARETYGLGPGRTAKLCALDILRPTPYDRTLFLDSDLLICGDLRAFACADVPLAACPEASSLKGKARDPVSFRITDNGLRDAFNSGVLSLSGSLCTADTYAQACDMVRSNIWARLGTGHADQTILNLLLEGKQSLFPPDYNFLLQHQEVSAPKVQDRIRVYHFGLSPKPWQPEGHGHSALAQEARALWQAKHQRHAKVAATPTPRTLGAQNDPRDKIKTHLFLLCPNSSGSTFLGNALARSRHIWSLPREGQHMLGYAGPNTREDHQLVWAAEPKVLAKFQDESLYNWPKTRQAWYFQARAWDAHASVFFTKAPPFLAISQSLRDSFPNARFLIMTRDPYAVVEGIFRFYQSRESDHQNLIDRAAAHVLRCFEMQQRNIEQHKDIAVRFTYEDLCDDPGEIADQIRGLVPQLDDLDLGAATSVKARYFEPLRNMNPQQIARLSKAQIARINRRFEPHAALLGDLGYSLR